MTDTHQDDHHAGIPATDEADRGAPAAIFERLRRVKRPVFVGWALIRIRHDRPRVDLEAK